MELKRAAKLHHYVPQAYLAAFTDEGNKGGRFFVLEVRTGRSFNTSPKNVAAEKDFNRVDIEGKPPDVIEQALSLFEGHAAKAIRNVIANEQFPNNEDYNYILNLLGFIAVHNPRHRTSLNRTRVALAQQIADLLVCDERIYDHYVLNARKSGVEIRDDVSFKDLKWFVKEREYRIEISPEGHVGTGLRIFDKLLPVLGQRTWSLLVAPRRGPEFICSDHPVTLVSKNQRRGPLGFGLKETEVFFPLGRKVGFYGVFEAPLPPVVKLKPGYVAAMNRRIALNAQRHVFSALESFAMWHEGQIRKVHCGSNPRVEKDAANRASHPRR